MARVVCSGSGPTYVLGSLKSGLKLSGENRAELERVLLHYKDNPKKKKAAEFLIRNMKWCHAEDLIGDKLAHQEQHPPSLLEPQPQQVSPSINSLNWVRVSQFREYRMVRKRRGLCLA